MVLAVSGGGDSVALARLMAAQVSGAEDKLHIAHFDHARRGAASREDAAFVRELAESLSLPFHGGRWRKSHGEDPGCEASAREARYRFLRETAENLGARYVATAHTADDQVETILHRVVRGTGLTGLAGIPRARQLSPAVTLLRPLLEFRREELQAYLREISQPFREDPSNAELEFTRNRVRNVLIPWLEREIHPSAAESLIRLGNQARETVELLHELRDELWARSLLEPLGQSASFCCAALAREPALVLRELFIRLWEEQGWPRGSMTAEHWHSLAALAQCPTEPAAPHKLQLPGGILATREARTLTIERK